jgi:D-3-phosphoglycerate dehydrogenase
MRKIRILVAEKSSFSQQGLEAFSKIGETNACDLAQTELIQQVKDFSVLIVRLGLLVDAQVLHANPNLLAVGTPTTGLDHIDLELAKNLGVVILSLKGERAFLDQVYATAEHSMALMLALMRRIPAASASVGHYEWRRDIYRGSELYGKVLGVVGCGRLGRMVARYGDAFGMQVYVYDPYLLTLPDGTRRCQSLNELLQMSDVVSIHVPLNDETIGMFSEAQFANVRPGSWLINTSRGSIIDETALLQALETGRLAGAALDVLVGESELNPANPNELIEYARTHDNLLITPHIGGATRESVEKADLFIANKLEKFLKTRI